MAIKLLKSDLIKELSDVDFTIEASSFEWTHIVKRFKECSQEIDIKDESFGFLPTVGRDENNKPICISLSFATINSKKILILDPTSSLVDWETINDWFVLSNNWDKERIQQNFWTNATNNHLLYHFCISKT
jgi:hypothetical protein